MRLNLINDEIYLDEPIGKQPKHWLISYDTKYLYKKATYKQDGSPVYNDVSECIAADIAELIGVPSAEYYLCTKDGEKGVITPDFLDNKIGEVKKEEFFDGVYLINQVDPGFKNTSLINPQTHQYYTVELIIQSVKEYGFIKEVLNMIIFDCLIANRDRNPSNYGIIVNHENKKVRFAPVFDSCASLGASLVSHRLAKCYDKDGNIIDNNHLNLVVHKQFTGKVTLERHFQYIEKAKWDKKETQRILTKIESTRIDLQELLKQGKITVEDYHKTLTRVGNEYRKYDITSPNYQLIISYLTMFYAEEIDDIMNKIKENITEENIDRIFAFYEGELPIDRANISKEIVLRRGKWITDFYEKNKTKSEGKLL